MPQDHANLPAAIPTNNAEIYRMSTDAAGLCGAIVKQTAQKIEGRNYVKVEGWQAIAVAHGCAASSCDVERVAGGFRATGQVRRMDNGAVVAEAEGFVGEDEPVWFGGEGMSYGKPKTFKKRPDYAIRAMAQTRAISRACRSAFAHVVVMIDKDLSTTPAEEVPDGGFNGTYTHAAAAQEAVTDGLATTTKSTYEVDKLKTAIAFQWKSMNKTPKGREDQIFDYLDMARNPDDIAKILNNNEETIANSPKKDEIEGAADKLLRYFEKQAVAA